jgi:FKBP-type peptidyl-prolyl cis-trans isomerase
MEQTPTSPVPAPETTCARGACGRGRLPLVLGVLAVATAIPAWILPAVSGGDRVAVAEASGFLGLANVGPESITGMRVVSWDDALSASRIFEVKRDGDRWVIPSNHFYPADGNTRVTKTAAGVLGAAKGRLVTDKAGEHEALGVVDPLDTASGAKAGFGKRITLTDNTGATALDVIVGNRAESGSGVFYVREAGKSEVWTAKVDGDISTRFTDYVETDPFKIVRDDVRGVAVVDYQVDPDRGVITPGPVTKSTRPAQDKDWESGQVPEGKRVAKAKVDEVLSELSYMRLQGVRPFDPRWLQSRGFYLGDQPQLFQLPNALTVQLQGKPYALFGTQGRLDVTTRDGLRYSFMFGKVALGDDQDKEPELKQEEKKEGEAKQDEAAASNRYVAVFVTYDASLDETAKEAKTDGAAPAVKLTGKQRAERAQARFQQFFYVISDASFKKLRPDVQQWWEEKPKEPMAGSTGKTVKQWLADNAGLPGITTTASGLQYQVLASGPEGGPKPEATDQVRVAYKGTLIDGEQFDANDDMRFAVNGVIKGWTEALQLMKPGDTWKLFIPPEIGYGETGSPPKIGPNAILVFEVTLKEVVGKSAPAAAPAPAAPAEQPAPAPAEAPPTAP